MVFNRAAKNGNNALLNEHFNYAPGQRLNERLSEQRRRATVEVLYTYGNLFNLFDRLNEIPNDSVNKGVIINGQYM